MLSDIQVYVSVWLALAGWFAGSGCRALGRRGRRGTTEVLYRYAWLFGAVMIVLHIIASYAITYQWSHAAAVEATAEESQRVTGIRAGWGVYVNFAFATVWLGYSFAMIRAGRRLPGFDPGVFWFTAAIVFSATVIFEAGAIRRIALGGFALLIVLGRCRQWGSEGNWYPRT